MLSDGLKYQDSRMATCEEMKQDLAPFALHDAAAKSKGVPLHINFLFLHLDNLFLSVLKVTILRKTTQNIRISMISWISPI